MCFFFVGGLVGRAAGRVFVWFGWLADGLRSSWQCGRWLGLRLRTFQGSILVAASEHIRNAVISVAMFWLLIGCGRRPGGAPEKSYQTSRAYILMAYIGTACIGTAYIGTAYMVTPI